jgi:hypothetical protein
VLNRRTSVVNQHIVCRSRRRRENICRTSCSLAGTTANSPLCASHNSSNLILPYLILPYHPRPPIPSHPTCTRAEHPANPSTPLHQPRIVPTRNKPRRQGPNAHPRNTTPRANFPDQVCSAADHPIPSHQRRLTPVSSNTQYGTVLTHRSRSCTPTIDNTLPVQYLPSGRGSATPHDMTCYAIRTSQVRSADHGLRETTRPSTVAGCDRHGHKHTEPAPPQCAHFTPTQPAFAENSVTLLVVAEQFVGLSVAGALGREHRLICRGVTAMATMGYCFEMHLPSAV